MKKVNTWCGECGEEYLAEECPHCYSNTRHAFQKFDEDKLQLDLLPKEWVEGLTHVMMYGAKKYAPDNWKNCPDPRRYTNAAGRHLLMVDHGRGPELDSESGLHHLLHAAVSCLMAYSIQQAQTTDREDE